MSATLRPAPRWQMQAQAAFVNARFDDFDEPDCGRLVSRAGNRPFNVPDVVVGASGSYRFGLRRPLEVGLSYRHVGERFTTTDNAITLLGYDVVDAIGAWTYQRMRVTLRLRNLFDEDYALWGDNFYPAQVLLGAPRSAEIGVGFRF